MIDRIDDHDAHRRLAAADGPALVLFTTPFCGGCRAWREVVAKLAAARDDLVVFEADAGDAPGLVADLELFHFPALQLFQRGEPLGAIEAGPTVAALAAAVDRALAG